MKRFVRVEQTYYTTVIMDIDDAEDDNEIEKRIMERVNEVSPETMICCGGEITWKIDKRRKVKDEDEESFEVID